jgi:hypothetical protein
MGEARRRRLALDALRKALAERFPALQLVTDHGRYAISGMFVIEHEGQELDRFAVDVDLRKIRGGLPTVKEVAGRLPRHVDRHVNGDGTLCVCLPEQYFLRNPGGFDVMAFLDGPVRDFFMSQALVEKGDPWPYGTWDHREAGQKQWLEEFGRSLTDAQRTVYLSAVTVPTLDGRSPCPCGSARDTRDCHWNLLLALRAQLAPPTAASVFSPSAAAPTADGRGPR